MKVSILRATPDLMDLISQCAGICYGKDDINHKRVKNCFNKNHMSVFEHASFTAIIEGISRACSHQLVRHRLASFSQQSQRYTRISGDDWYVMPETLNKADNHGTFLMKLMLDAKLYQDAIEAGVPYEDARFLLPEATKTTIAMTMNVRELFHFLDVRTDKSAQWEIRLLAAKIINALKEVDDQWAELIGLWETKIKTREEKIQAIIEFFGADHDPDLAREATKFLDWILRR